MSTVPKLDADLIKMISPAIRRVWETIGGDIEEGLNEAKERLTNVIALEATLDANYLTTFGGAEGKMVDDLIPLLNKEYGYKKVEKFLLANIRLA